MKPTFLFLFVSLTAVAGRGEVDVLPVTLLLQDGSTRSVEMTSWKEDHIHFKTGEGEIQSLPEDQVRAVFTQSGGYGFVESMDESMEGWDISHIRMSAARWVEGEGWWFENASSRKLRYTLPKGGRTPMEVELEIAFPDAAPGVVIHVYPKANPDRVGGGPQVFFRMRQGYIFCGTILSGKSVSQKFDVPKDHEGPWTVRMHLDPKQNRYQVDLNGNVLATWKEEDGAVPENLAFRTVDVVLDVKTPVNVRKLDLRLTGRNPDGKNRVPPYVEFANGDLLPLRVVGWDEKGFWLQTDDTKPFPVPSERVIGIWLR